MMTDTISDITVSGKMIGLLALGAAVGFVAGFLVSLPSAHKATRSAQQEAVQSDAVSAMLRVELAELRAKRPVAINAVCVDDLAKSRAAFEALQLPLNYGTRLGEIVSEGPCAKHLSRSRACTGPLTELGDIYIVEMALLKMKPGG